MCLFIDSDITARGEGRHRETMPLVVVVVAVPRWYSDCDTQTLHARSVTQSLRGLCVALPTVHWFRTLRLREVSAETDLPKG